MPRSKKRDARAQAERQAHLQSSGDVLGDYVAHQTSKSDAGPDVTVRTRAISRAKTTRSQAKRQRLEEGSGQLAEATEDAQKAGVNPAKSAPVSIANGIASSRGLQKSKSKKARSGVSTTAGLQAATPKQAKGGRKSSHDRSSTDGCGPPARTRKGAPSQQRGGGGALEKSSKAKRKRAARPLLEAAVVVATEIDGSRGTARERGGGSDGIEGPCNGSRGELVVLDSSRACGVGGTTECASKPGPSGGGSGRPAGSGSKARAEASDVIDLVGDDGDDGSGRSGGSSERSGHGAAASIQDRGAPEANGPVASGSSRTHKAHRVDHADLQPQQPQAPYEGARTTAVAAHLGNTRPDAASTAEAANGGVGAACSSSGGGGSAGDGSGSGSSGASESVTVAEESGAVGAGSEGDSGDLAARWGHLRGVRVVSRLEDDGLGAVRRLLRTRRYHDDDVAAGASVLSQSRLRIATTRCFRCGLPGHLARECTNPPALRPCSKCAAIGHEADSCPNSLCFNCGEAGHVVRDCSKPPLPPRSLLCIRCGKPDCDASRHRDIVRAAGKCTKRYAASDLEHVRCVTCGKYGHLCCAPLPKEVPRGGCCLCGETGHSGLLGDCPHGLPSHLLAEERADGRAVRDALDAGFEDRSARDARAFRDERLQQLSRRRSRSRDWSDGRIDRGDSRVNSYSRNGRSDDRGYGHFQYGDRREPPRSRDRERDWGRRELSSSNTGPRSSGSGYRGAASGLQTQSRSHSACPAPGSSPQGYGPQRYGRQSVAPPPAPPPDVIGYRGSSTVQPHRVGAQQQRYARLGAVVPSHQAGHGGASRTPYVSQASPWLPQHAPRHIRFG